MMVTVVIPCYKETKNIPILLDKIFHLNESKDIYEVIIVEDISNETSRMTDLLGTFNNVKHIKLTSRSLSKAVMVGITNANSELVVVMDGDLQHEPESIPDLVNPLKLSKEIDMVVGCRNEVNNWSLDRRIISLGATVLARGLTRCKDPMSGFFCIRRNKVIENIDKIRPIGFKIGLELMVRCKIEPINIEIEFQQRNNGESKLTFYQMLLYLFQIMLLYCFLFREKLTKENWEKLIYEVNKIFEILRLFMNNIINGTTYKYKKKWV